MKPELLMPAGDLEKTKIAFQFGADACYGSTSAFSMRTREIGFSYKTLKEAIDYAHKIDKKFYVTLNTYPHEFELAGLKKHIKKLILMKPDAIILADPGVISFVTNEIKKQDTRYKSQKRKSVKTEIHISTQANTTNSESIKFWHKLGVKRFILAREVSLKEIKEIIKNLPKTAEIETFVHGAMCNSVSGRCNLSNYLTGRDANRGTCVQACRWKYALVEESRPNQYIPISEDETGSYIFNSKDLCMIEHLKELYDAGVRSFKVEGRNKSIYYVAIVARAYRHAIDSICHPNLDCHPEQSEGSQDSSATPQNDINKIIDETKNELLTVTSRGYSTGFFFGKPTDEAINYETSRPTSDWQFVGIVKDKFNNSTIKQSNNFYLIEGRNEIFPNSTVEVVAPDEVYKIKIKKFVLPDGEIVEKANPNMEFILESKNELPINSMLRAKK